jgi:signal transduction histidine kinase
MLEVWRRNFAYDFEMLGTVALFLISPVLVVAYLAAGAPAFVLFALPLVLIRKGNRDYIELRRTQASVVAAERLAAKGEMAAGIAHELNNYLAALRGGTQLMERQLRSADLERVEKRLGLVREQVDNMAVLTRGLMEFAHREVSLARVDLTDLARRTVAFLSPQRRFDGLDIEVEEAPATEILVDPAQIQQVLVNLLNNAADALREVDGGSTVIRVRITRDRKELRLAVIDEGAGMTDSVQARIFEPTFTTKPDGHGFGLATCQRIAANHGGKLVVESAPGRGTTLTLVLPVRDGTRRAESNDDGRLSRPGAAAPRARDGDTDPSRPREG